MALSVRVALACASLLCAVTLVSSPIAAQSENGLVTEPSNNPVAVTIDRFETAVKEAGMKVFARIDHAAAATEAGLAMPASVIIFGAPRGGTPNFLKAPTLAIDLPLKALVWQDAAGKVFITYNSGAYVGKTVFPRHGLPAAPDGGAGQEKLLAGFAAAAAR